jgi:hypothetical protein
VAAPAVKGSRHGHAHEEDHRVIVHRTTDSTMNSQKSDPPPPYRLRASAPCGVSGTSSMLRVARTNTVDRRCSTLRVPHNPQQLAFDFHRAR